MSATFSLEKPAAGAQPRPQRQAKTTGGKELGRDTSREAKRLAAAILEVLAGARTPAEAATALGLSVPRYYQVERRALQGLLSACEPKPKGRVRRPEHEAGLLRGEIQRLRHEVTRQQSLARAAQRTVGWIAPVPASAPKSAAGKSGKKKRMPRFARALSVAGRLRQSTPDAAPAAEVPPVLSAT